VKLLHPDLPAAEFLAPDADPPQEHPRWCCWAVCFSCLDPVLTIAASLSHRTPFETPLGAEQEVKQCKLQLAEGCESDHLLPWLAYKLELIRAVVTAGLYPNIVRCKSLKSKKAVADPASPSYELPQAGVACGFEEPAWLAYFEKCLLNDRRTARTRTNAAFNWPCWTTGSGWLPSTAAFSTVLVLRHRLDLLLADLIHRPGRCLKTWSAEAANDSQNGFRCSNSECHRRSSGCHRARKAEAMAVKLMSP
uniref:OB_NTP_bind domain-containing protein n=1 Tax=Macrostomum lignano TaxID=282301 RepID=A0A1I8FFW9_9PLAT